MIPSAIARDAPTSIRRACPLCPEDKPDLGPNQEPDLAGIEYTDPELITSHNGHITQWIAPEVVYWLMGCGHTLYANEWSHISSALARDCASPIYMWWVPRALFDIAWAETTE